MLSVCIIAKNEERNIGHCLECLKNYEFELIVVDTGSSDRTKEIVQQYTQNIYDFDWCDDFAAAKNYAISKASNPYVLILDSDEYLEPLKQEELYRLIQQHPDQVGRIRIRNVFTKNKGNQENQEWLNRIFPKDSFHYTGRIHEQVTAEDERSYETYQTMVKVIHTGYDLAPEENRKKAQRNKTLLEKELVLLEQEENEEQIPYIIYQLGKSYYMEGDYKTSCHWFSKGLSYDLEPKLEYVIDMVETYGYALINSGQAEQALFFENIIKEFGNNADFMFLMGLIYMNNARFEQAVQAFLEAVTHKKCRSQGVNSYAAYYNVGVIYECLGEMEKAIFYYKKSGNYQPALQRLKECRKR